MNRNPTTPHDLAPAPNAEWHGGVTEHGFIARSVSEGELKARGVSQGALAEETPSPTLRASIRTKTVHGLALWLVLWSLLLLPLLGGFVPTADDLGAYHLPLRSFYQSALQLGENWTWCPWIFGGYHLHGEGQIGGDHPLHQLLYRALPLHWAFGLECWWAYPATFFGMWWWLRQIRFSTPASQIAGLTLSLCGFMTLRLVHVNAIQVIAHLPWLLGTLTWLEHRARRSMSIASVVGPIALSGALTGSQLLLGYPQYVVFTLIAEVLWLASLMIRSPHARPAMSLGWLVAKGIGLLLGAAQIMPTLEYLARSERMSWSADTMYEGSWPLLNLTQLVAPYLFTNRVVGQNTHELTIYMGIVPVCLAVLGLVNRPRSSLRVVKGYALALCTVGLLLALGEKSPVAEVMSYIPGWNRFRFPCRATLLLCLGLVLLAVLGWQRVCQLAHFYQPNPPGGTTIKGFTRRESHVLWLCIATSCLLPLGASLAWPEYVAGWQVRAIAPLLMSTSLWLLEYAVRGGTCARNLLPVLLCLDLCTYGITTQVWKKQSSIAAVSLPELKPIAAGVSHTGGIGPRILDPPTHRTSMGDRDDPIESDHERQREIAGHTLINGYAGLKPAKVLNYDGEHHGALNVAGVTQIYGSGRGFGKSGGDIRTLSGSLSRGTLVTKTIIAGDWQQQIERLDPHTTALVERAVQLDSSVATDHLKIQTTADRPGHLSFGLDTNRDVLLVTTESFHPGWRVRVDGADVPALRVNGDFLGARVARDSRCVECYFSDNWHTVGRWLSLGSLGLLGIVLLFSRRQRGNMELA